MHCLRLILITKENQTKSCPIFIFTHLLTKKHEPKKRKTKAKLHWMEMIAPTHEYFQISKSHDSKYDSTKRERILQPKQKKKAVPWQGRYVAQSKGQIILLHYFRVKRGLAYMPSFCIIHRQKKLIFFLLTINEG